MISFTVYGQPYIKKSNQRTIWNGRRIVRIDTPRYRQWHSDALKQFMLLQPKPEKPIDFPVNLQLSFFMKDARPCDLSALYEGIQDVLVEVGILADDNYKIVASHDGSGVEVDSLEPRMEIKITPK